jgi:enoyl-CoA hydratase/carnithine racemase
VTYGMVAGYESVHLMQKAPFGEVMRIALLGNYERMSAERAHQIGLVSEVVPQDKLMEAATWAAEAIASQPPAAIQGTVRAMWMGLDSPRSVAIELAPLVVRLGTTNDNINEGQSSFTKAERPKHRIR